jgi:Fe-S oxidoreductase
LLLKEDKMARIKTKEVYKLDVTDIENFRYDADRCVGCKGCVWVDHIYMPGVTYGTKCPSLERYAFDAYAAYGRLKIALGLMDGELVSPPGLGKIDYSPTLLDVIYKCQLCGACDAGCKRNVDLEPMLVLEALRVKAVQDGQGPLPAHRKLAENIASSHNRYGAPHENRLKWLPDEVKPAAKADIVYFPGCAASYTNSEISKATAKILTATNTDFMVLDDEWCCGEILYETGQIDAARQQAQHNIDAIQRSGASTVLVSCAECYHALKVTYPKIFNKSTADMGYKVVHLVEFIGEKIKSGDLKFTNKVELKATYHDACHLARLSEPWTYWEGKRGKWGVIDPPREYRRGINGIYETPREILRGIPGVELVEMIRIRENAWCCGAGAGMRELDKDFALWTAGERLKEAKEVGAEAIVSACPRCKDNFEEAIKLEKGRIKVYDISELVLQAI